MQSVGTPDDRELVRSLCNLEIPTDIRISPSGEKVLYSTSLTWGHVAGQHSVSTLWLATLSETNSSKPITSGKFKDHSPAWHPSKDDFAFISDRAGNGTKSAIYTASNGNFEEFTAITPVENEQAIEKFHFSPHGNMIAFISKEEKTAEEKKREEDKEDVQVWGQNYKYSGLRVIDLETREINTFSFDEHVLDFCWIDNNTGSSAELQIGLVSCKTTVLEDAYQYGTEIHIITSDLQHSRKLYSLPGRVCDLCWGSANFESSELYFSCGDPVDKNFYGNSLYKIAIGKEVGQYERVSFEGVHDVISVRSIDGHIVVKVRNRLDDCLIWVGCLELYHCAQEIDAWDVAFGFSDGEERLAIATSDINNPVEVYTMARTDSKRVKLSQHGDNFFARKFGTCTTLTCPTADDNKIDIDGLLLQPTVDDSRHRQNTTSEPLPTVVLLHGGPTTRVTDAFNTLYYMWTPYLLHLGYTILLPNYRGSSGRGRDFASFSYRGGGNHAYSDVIALTQYAVEQGYADPERLVIGGVSHGGLLTNLCAVRNGSYGHGWSYKAAISVSSISDIDAMGLTSDMGNAYHGELHNNSLPWTMSAENTFTRSGSALWQFKQAMDRSKKDGVSVIPPMLIMHGVNDERCHVSNTWGLRRALEHYSLPFEMAIYPRQGHMIHEQNFWIDMALRVGRWIEQHIGSGKRDQKMAPLTDDG